MSRYAFLAANLTDQTVVDEVPFETFQWTQPLDAAGNFSGTLPLRSSRGARGDSGTYTGTLLPNRTEVIVVRDGVPLWSGILTGVRKRNERLTFDGIGLLGYFGSRLLRETRTYTAVDQLTIARDILLWSQGQGSLTYGATVGPAEGDIGLTVENETSGVTRDRTYDGFQHKVVEDVVRQMTMLRNGFDIGVSYSLSGATVSREAFFTYPSAGRDTERVFDFPGVIEDYDWSSSGRRYANDVTVIGAGEGDQMVTGRAQDAASLSTFPLWESRSSYKDISVQSTADDRASAHLTASKVPVDQLDAQLRGGLGSWTVGDQVTVDLSDAYVTATGRHRIVGQTVKVDANGGEKITVNLLPAALTAQ